MNLDPDRMLILLLAAIAAGVVSLFIEPLYFLIGPAGCLIIIPACVLAYGLAVAPQTPPDTEPEKPQSPVQQELPL